MMQPVYILSASAISPQDSFEPELFLKEVHNTTTGKLSVREPDYRQFINPVAIRRMSRLLKMGIATGTKALQQANVTMPDAIITGTGLGSMTDTEKFLKDMITFHEETLNPTFFIQSTYNSVNGWLSLQTKATGYNQTYVHRGFSAEMALLDAQLFLNEHTQPANVLAGAFDEMTEEYFLVKSKIGYWKKTPPESQNLLQHTDTEGSIGGEGAAFFVLSNQKQNAICKLSEINMIENPSEATIQAQINELLARHQLTVHDIDFIICGKNGDSRFENFYTNALSDFVRAETNTATFKHLTGEYPTASAFALWLATQFFQSKEILEKNCCELKRPIAQPRNILIVNHYILNTASLLLLQQ